MIFGPFSPLAAGVRIPTAVTLMPVKGETIAFPAPETRFVGEAWVRAHSVPQWVLARRYLVPWRRN
jgi:hypothetical protein